MQQYRFLLQVGDSIEVMQKKEDGWWKGRVHGLDWTGEDNLAASSDEKLSVAVSVL